jgi:hypothetical protein
VSKLEDILTLCTVLGDSGYIGLNHSSATGTLAADRNWDPITSEGAFFHDPGKSPSDLHTGLFRLPLRNAKTVTLANLHSSDMALGMSLLVTGRSGPRVH